MKPWDIHGLQEQTSGIQHLPCAPRAGHSGQHRPLKSVASCDLASYDLFWWCSQLGGLASYKMWSKTSKFPIELHNSLGAKHGALGRNSQPDPQSFKGRGLGNRFSAAKTETWHKLGRPWSVEAWCCSAARPFENISLSQAHRWKPEKNDCSHGSQVSKLDYELGIGLWTSQNAIQN